MAITEYTHPNGVEPKDREHLNERYPNVVWMCGEYWEMACPFCHTNKPRNNRVWEHGTKSLLGHISWMHSTERQQLADVAARKDTDALLALCVVRPLSPEDIARLR